MFLKENIEMKNCLMEQITSAIYVMVYIASLRGYQVLWKEKKRFYIAKKYFLMFVILMINLFPKHKLVFL